MYYKDNVNINNKNNMEDYTEEDLFEDVDSGSEGGQDDGALAGELADEGGTGGDEDASDDNAQQGNVIDNLDLSGAGEELSGVERFLSGYGIQGGLITYEDGETAHFSTLQPDEQEEILQSLTKESVPSIEEKYNLEEGEIELLNVLRESNQSAEEFINNIVDYRLGNVIAQRDATSIDFENMPADAMFVRQLKDSNPDMSADDVANELDAAMKLTTFETTVDAIKQGYIAKQNEYLAGQQNEQNNAFYDELEMQRSEVVQTIEGISDVAGAVVTDEMKEYLLHDIMELNSEQDPLLMEKIFSSPEDMFKANWFLTYGEDYIKNMNDYWKKEVSKAAKTAYNRATHEMPGEPQGGFRAPEGKKQNIMGQGSQQGRFGEVISEEDLFDE